MSTQTLPGAGQAPAGTPRPAGPAGAAAAEKLPPPRADPPADWPLDVRLPDEEEDDEC